MRMNTRHLKRYGIQRRSSSLMISRRTSHTLLFLVVLLGALVADWRSISVLAQYDDDFGGYAKADEDNMEYVRQVLEEEGEAGDSSSDNPYDNAYSTEEQYQRAQEEMLRQQQEQKRQDDERRAQEREAEFERQLQKLDREEQKKARRTKRRHAKVVNALLRAFEEKDYYAVLGLKRQFVWRQRAEQMLPGWVRHSPLQKYVGAFQPLSSATLKKAYRTMGKLVHPDKNQDGRAEQAFVALDEVYQLLSDEENRSEYDKKLLEQRQKEGFLVSDWGRAGKVLQGTQVVVVHATKVVKNVLGPFTVPVSILAVVFV